MKHLNAFCALAVSAVALTGIAQAAPPDHGEEFCAGFRFIYDQRFQSFQRLRGFAKDSSERADYNSLVIAPNASYCNISRPSRADGVESSYHCAWRFKNLEDAMADAQGLAHSIKVCLGPGTSSNTGWESTPPPLFQEWLTVVGDSKTIMKIRLTEPSYSARPEYRYVLFMTIEVRD